MKQLEGEKANMEDLLQLIPELNGLFTSFNGTSIFLNVELKEDYFIFPEKVLDHYHMTENRFQEFYKTKSQVPSHFQINTNNGIGMRLELDKAQDPVPLRYNFEQNTFHLPIVKNDLLHYPEILIHYLLLYNLSMIARYETEWWSELVKMMPNKDYPFICRFLSIALNKGPYLVYQYLEGHLK
jgi:hypothetical protein